MFKPVNFSDALDECHILFSCKTAFTGTTWLLPKGPTKHNLSAVIGTSHRIADDAKYFQHIKLCDSRHSPILHSYSPSALIWILCFPHIVDPLMHWDYWSCRPFPVRYSLVILACNLCSRRLFFFLSSLPMPIPSPPSLSASVLGCLARCCWSLKAFPLGSLEMREGWLL